MMKAIALRGDEDRTRGPLSGAQAEFVAELGRACPDLAGMLRKSCQQTDPAEALALRERACTGLQRQSQRAHGFRLHDVGEELRVIAEKTRSSDDLLALATATEEAPRLAWAPADDSSSLSAKLAAVTPAPSSGLRDRSAPFELPLRGDFRVRVLGGDVLRAWADQRTDLTPVDESSRGDLLVIDARDGSEVLTTRILQDAMEPLVVVIGNHALARAHGAIAVDTLSELEGIVELSKTRRETALSVTPAPVRSAKDLGLELVEELHRALVDSIEPSSAPVAVPLGRDPMIAAALWSAIARIRELISRRTEGSVRFADTGPEGSLAFAAEFSEVVRPVDRRRTADRAADIRLHGLRAIVVDDDEAVAWFIAEQLRSAGMIVTVAYDGETARGLAESLRPDIVVSDIVMPGLDGLSLGRALRRDVTLGDVPLVLLSWKEDLLRRVRELGSDADGYARKESDGDHLIATVREALRPRLRLAMRLETEATVHGRLDGMTAHSLARIVADRKTSSRVSLRDGRHVFELDFIGGLLAGCTRSGADGSLLRGRRALASYLGVRSARFEVSALSRVSSADTAKPLALAVQPLVERARASVELIAEMWLSLASLEIDLDLVDSGAPALPASFKRGLDGLRDGIAPHRLVASGMIDADDLLALLLDLARRGAIVSARDNLGTDRLLESLARVRGRGQVSAPETRFSRPIVVPIAIDSFDDVAPQQGDVPTVVPVTFEVPAEVASEAPQEPLAGSANEDCRPTLPEVSSLFADVEGAILAPSEAAVETASPEVPVAATRMASPILVRPRAISWIGFLLALGLIALGGTVASWLVVRHLPTGHVPTVFR